MEIGLVIKTCRLKEQLIKTVSKWSIINKSEAEGFESILFAMLALDDSVMFYFNRETVLPPLQNSFPQHELL